VDIVTKEFVNADFHQHGECRHPLEKQRIATTLVSVTYQLTEFCVVLFMNLWQKAQVGLDVEFYVQISISDTEHVEIVVTLIKVEPAEIIAFLRRIGRLPANDSA